MSQKEEKKKAGAMNAIPWCLKQLAKEHYLTDEEISYEIRKGTASIEITMNEKLSRLIAQQPPEKCGGNGISFRKDGENTYIMTLKRKGSELEYFAEILDAVLHRLNHEKKQRVWSNRQRIDDALDEVIKASNVQLICPKKSKYSKQIYWGIVFVGNKELTAKNRNVELLLEEIWETFPRRIQNEYANIV